RIDAHLGAAGIENPQHDLFPPQGGQGIDAEVDGARLRQSQLDAAVVRHALFRDVNLRHDLEARTDAVGDALRRTPDLAQDAVLAEADAVDLLVGFDVDVRGPRLDGVHEDAVDEAHDGRVVDAVFRLGVLFVLLAGLHLN